MAELPSASATLHVPRSFTLGTINKHTDAVSQRVHISKITNILVTWEIYFFSPLQNNSLCNAQISNVSNVFIGLMENLDHFSNKR